MSYTTENQAKKDRSDVLDPAPAGAAVENGDSAPNKSFAQELLAALLRYRDGDFGARMPSDLLGIDGKIADVFNEILAVSARRAAETVARLPRGRQGRQAQGAHAACRARSAAGPTRSARSTR